MVDDRRSLVWFVERVLRQEGFRTVAAFSGDEGLLAVRRERPDLIVLDTVMPGMTGFAMYRHLQADPATSGIPVLLLTVAGQAGRALGAPVAGGIGVDFLPKPFSAEAVLRHVKALLDASQADVADPAPVRTVPRVLIVDDTKSLVRLAEQALQKEGLDVITAFDGLDGLRKAKDEKPDLIILDIILPELDGFQVLELVRQQSSVPVIMLTADNDAEAVRTSLRLGADGYVVKPVTTTELLARVREQLVDAGWALGRSPERPVAAV
ncbi:MAG: response regulator [Dehalococcoidales bacterium]